MRVELHQEAARVNLVGAVDFRKRVVIHQPQRLHAAGEGVAAARRKVLGNSRVDI